MGVSCTGVPVTPDTILHTGYESLSTHLVDVTTSDDASSPASRDVAAPSEVPESHKALQERVLKRILGELIFHSRPEVTPQLIAE